jgi:hypothetical protein
MIILLSVWLVCGFITYGGAYADQRASRSSPRDSSGAALFFAFLGPGGLFVTFLFTGFYKHGMRWRG